MKNCWPLCFLSIANGTSSMSSHLLVGSGGERGTGQGRVDRGVRGDGEVTKGRGGEEGVLDDLKYGWNRESLRVCLVDFMGE